MVASAFRNFISYPLVWILVLIAFACDCQGNPVCQVSAINNRSASSVEIGEATGVLIAVDHDAAVVLTAGHVLDRSAAIGETRPVVTFTRSDGSVKRVRGLSIVRGPGDVAAISLDPTHVSDIEPMRLWPGHADYRRNMLHAEGLRSGYRKGRFARGELQFGSYQGDSGGPVYVMDSNRTKYVVGIVAGSDCKDQHGRDKVATVTDATFIDQFQGWLEREQQLHISKTGIVRSLVFGRRPMLGRPTFGGGAVCRGGQCFARPMQQMAPVRPVPPMPSVPYTAPPRIAPPTPRPVQPMGEFIEGRIRAEFPVEDVVARVMDRIRRDPSFRGADGRDGTDGRDGSPGTPGRSITESEIQAMTNALYQRMRDDPTFRGPEGRAGEPGVSPVIDEDALAKRLLQNLPDIEVVINGEKMSQSLYKAAASGKPALFDIDLNSQLRVRGQGR